MNHFRYRDALPYETKDGSIIRELMHPATHGNRNQSLAEASVAAGACTRRHRHRQSEEIYFITAGIGRMSLGDRTFPIETGDSVCIPPGTWHALANTGTEVLKVLCVCSPPYAHEDTELE